MSLDLLLRGQFAFMKAQGFEVCAGSSSGREIEAIIAREGVAHHVFPFSRTISPLLDLVAIFRLVRFLRSHKFQIVHTHTPKAGLLGMIAAWICRVPIRMHTVAGLPLMETKGLKRKVLLLVERLTYHCATGVYPNSFKMMEYIQRHIYSSETKLKVIGNGSSNGIDTDYFQTDSILERRALAIKDELQIPLDHKVAIFIGRITGDKGINELVGAFKSFEKLSLILVGPFEPDLDPLDDQTVLEIQQNPNIHAVGYQSEIRPYLLAADFLAFPSYREGFPNVPMQAGAMGLPSIVTDINGCNEIIAHEINGLIIPVKDQNALKLAIERLLNDAELFERMKEVARPMIVNRYDQKVVWEALHQEYIALIEEYVQ
ncbi:MAG: glycosyltransferase family 1 protein [Cytophagales bacterium CG12_big_fil_rev_8_21_14_0_65_40_12]|nr:MAG: glycosyltransferase family 1 protein [Cytophagales bacterium CG12_big_fil_rev_8_21_14_0_65_40_12]